MPPPPDLLAELRKKLQASGNSKKALREHLSRAGIMGPKRVRSRTWAKMHADYGD
jgi:hypothetical protein